MPLPSSALPRPGLRLYPVQTAEVFQDQSPVRRRQIPQLLGRRRRVPRPALEEPRIQRASERRRHVPRTLRLPLVRHFVPLQRAARVQEPMEEPLLARQDLRVQPPAGQLLGDPLRLPGQLIEPPQHVLAPAHHVVHAAELVRDLPLLFREIAQLAAQRLRREVQRQERVRLPVQRALLPGQVRELLQRFLEPRARLALRDLLPVLRQRQGEPVQRLHRPRRFRRRYPRRPIVPGHGVQRLLHAQHRAPERGAHLPVHQRRALPRLRQVPAQRMEPLLQGGLLGADRLHLLAPDLRSALLCLRHPVLEGKLPLGEGERLLRGLLDSLLHFLLPRLGHFLPRRVERPRGLLQLRRGLLGHLTRLLAGPLAAHAALLASGLLALLTLLALLLAVLALLTLLPLLALLTLLP